MSEEIGEIFYAMKEAGKERRRKNRKNGLEKVEKKGLRYTVHNDGAHIVIAGRIDYWPGTGLFKDRITGKRGRGVKKLMKHITDEYNQ